MAKKLILFVVFTIILVTQISLGQSEFPKLKSNDVLCSNILFNNGVRGASAICDGTDDGGGADTFAPNWSIGIVTPEGKNLTTGYDYAINSTGGGGGNPFDQSLNTTDNVTFNNLSLYEGNATLSVIPAGGQTNNFTINVAGKYPTYYGRVLFNLGQTKIMYDEFNTGFFGQYVPQITGLGTSSFSDYYAMEGGVAILQNKHEVSQLRFVEAGTFPNGLPLGDQYVFEYNDSKNYLELKSITTPVDTFAVTTNQFNVKNLSVGGDIGAINDSSKIYLGGSNDVSLNMNGSAFTIADEVGSISAYFDAFSTYRFDNSVWVKDLNMGSNSQILTGGNRMSHIAGSQLMHYFDKPLIIGYQQTGAPNSSLTVKGAVNVTNGDIIVTNGGISVDGNYSNSGLNGTTANYSIGTCWINVKGGIITSSNCTTF